MLRSFYKYAALGLAAVGAVSAVSAPAAARPSVIADNPAYVTIVAVMHPLPQYAQQVGTELKGLAAQVRAEPGNVAFMPTRNPVDNSYVVYEVYRSDDAFQKHITSDHTVSFNKILVNQVQGGASDVTKLKTIF
ncbi:MAG: putative quinol monooxygenase [Zymomonas mobilis]|uniref:putative quinol monooxygenase n=1 Tax=Zymomonas mobilis TaxID=542 RepID=UPI0039ED65A7